MKFLLDQSTDARLLPYLRDLGHDATRIGSDYPSGLSDEEVLAIAREEGRILITDDRDFGELIYIQSTKNKITHSINFPGELCLINRQHSVFDLSWIIQLILKIITNIVILGLLTISLLVVLLPRTWSRIE